MFSELAVGLADLLWPPRCVACSALLLRNPEYDLSSVFCRRCSDTVLFPESPMCRKCGLPHLGSGPDHLCSSCIESTPPFSRAWSAVLYGGAAATALLRFKYEPNPTLARPLGRLLAVAASNASPADAVLPIPLHPSRLRARGFNQSALLARRVSNRIGAALSPSLLRRDKDTVSQAGLSRQERAASIRGAFSVPAPHKIADKRVLLVDDVITTGATVREAAAVLIRSGAASVEVIAVARASGVMF